MAIVLGLTADPGIPHVLVEIQNVDDPRERRDVKPFMDFLRAQPRWAGGAKLVVAVKVPSALADAFRPATTILTAEQLQERAAIVWDHQQWSDTSLAPEWIGRTREALTAHLCDLALQHPELPFREP